MREVNQIIEYTAQDFLDCPDKNGMIELAMKVGYRGIFDYRFTDDCYREMLNFQDKYIDTLLQDNELLNEEITETIEQSIIDEMEEW